MSPKFAKVSFLYGGRRVVIHGVCYLSRGVPKCVILGKVTCKKESFKMIRSSYTLYPMPLRD